MAKSAKGAAAAKLIENATAAPGVFVFAELLELTNIQELSANPQHAPYLELLRLFSYGSYEEYKSKKDSYPALSPAQLTKLKYLSIVSLATQTRILSYPQLRTALDVGTLRELEDLIIDAMYQDVLRGRLDQKEQQLEVEYTMGRDVRPDQLSQLLSALKNWSSQTEQVINALDTKLAQIAAHQEQEKADRQVYETARAETLLDIAVQRKLAKRGQTGGEIDEMDVDPTSPTGGSGVASGMGFLSNVMGGIDPRRKKGTQPSSGAGSSSPSNTRKRNQKP